MNRKGKVKGKSNSGPMVKKPPWMELPEGIWANILHRLGAIEILETAEKVCSKWRRVCKNPSMWRVIDMWNLGDLSEMDFDLEVMCRHAVDRSQGEVVDINLQYFATGPLLECIAERSGKLKRLSIACCYGMVCESLVGVVQKLPLLEELSLTHTTITKEGIEALGRSCPQLKSFALNNSLYMGSGDYFGNEDVRNEEALAIAKNLPTLHHLQLIGNSMTAKGVEAILDNCPHLVSFDLRLCKYVSLNKVLSMVCESLVGVVQKLPLLEELSLTHTTITKEGIEALGRSCPQLKSFALNNSLYMGSGDYFGNEDVRNEEALAIAKNLPTLHHLQLIGNSMTAKGGEAILDNCPHLVSFDLRLCKYVSLNKVLSNRISGQIKDLKHPHDSLAGLEFGFEACGEDGVDQIYDDEDQMYDDEDLMYDDEDLMYDDY